MTYDIIEVPGQPNEARSQWWIWTLDYVTLGMTEPSMANWYFQGFFNWFFDGEALHNRPATIRVLRPRRVAEGHVAQRQRRAAAHRAFRARACRSRLP